MRGCSWVAILVSAAALAAPSLSVAQQPQERAQAPAPAQEGVKERAEAQQGAVEETPDGEGLRVASTLQFRGIPLGLALLNDFGYRVPLPGGEGLLTQGLYVEAGPHVVVSPAYLWAGGYVEVVPLAVLQLRFTALTMGYFGNFGLLYVPEVEGSRDWTLEEIQEAQDEGRGQAATGRMFEVKMVPRLKIGRAVAFAEIRWVDLKMDVDRAYWEPYHDLYVAPHDQIWVLRPTAGWIFGDPDDHFVLTGLRWERAMTAVTDVTRDMIAALAVWGIPSSWWSTGNPQLVALAGYFLQHPNREGSLWFGGQLSLTFGAR